jgi:nicotinate dehydrogenase subunit B
MRIQPTRAGGPDGHRTAWAPEAREALDRAGLSRRAFLERSGLLLVGFSLTGVAGTWGAAAGDAVGAAAAQVPRDAAQRVDAWIAISAEGRVTAYTGKCELGQGLLTAQVQLIAEELGVALEQVTLVQCDTAATPDQGTTSGSQSHPANFNEANLALAAATAREALVALAAERFGVRPAELVVERGVVHVKADPTRRVSYGELLGGRRFDLALDPTARRKPKREWTVLGRPVPRLDGAALVTGRFEYVHNVRLPGMLHGRVVRPPTVGAKLVSVDDGSASGLPGVVKVVVRRDFVGVVAEKPWQAMQAAARLKVKWTAGPPLPPQRDFYDWLRRQPSRDTKLVDSGDVEATLAKAARVLRATYLHPYQMHGSVGTACAVADVRDGEATVWSATQAVWPLRSTLAKLLGLPAEKVRVIFRMGPGCYGINGADTVAYDAALLSQAVGRPVRVQLTRRDEMAWENFGAAYLIEQRAGLAADGTILAWEYEAWVPTRGGRPGYDTPGNVVTGFLAGFDPATPAPRTPAPPPTAPFDNGANAAPSYVAGCVQGVCGGTGTVPSERVLTHAVASPFFTGPLRSPARLQNTFAHECFMDELAAAAGADPVAYRLRHLRDPRLIEVLRAAAAAAGWQPRPSPRPAAARAATRASGRGVACVLYEGDNGYAALVAEVEVDQASGEVRVTRFVVAHDCGPISNPDGLKNQIEGGLLQGMSRALVEEVTWDNDRVTSVDWRSYPSLSLGIEVPVIDIVLLDRESGPAMGAGETAITLVAAAIGNAIFDATGARVRQVPFTPARVKAALAART